jgi:hypothetical protein
MKKRYVLVLLAVMLASLFVFIPVSAYYTSISGELKDMKTLGPWKHGAVVRVYDAVNGTLLVSDTLTKDESTFNIGYTFSSSDPALILVEVDFTCEVATGCDVGDQYIDPADATYFGIQDSGDSGTWNTGTYLANTGPTAVNITGFSGISGMALMGVLPLAAAAGFGAVNLNRKKRQ